MDNYSAVQFIEDCQRACESHYACDGCPLDDDDTNKCPLVECSDAIEHLNGVKEKIELVHQWAKDNPIEPVKEERKEMTKADLKTAWIVELRDGRRFEALLGTDFDYGDILVNRNKQEFLILDSYSDNLKYNNGLSSSLLDIVKIYKQVFPYVYIDFENSDENLKLIWERKENQNKSILQDLPKKSSWHNALLVMNERQFLVRPEGKK